MLRHGLLAVAVIWPCAAAIYLAAIHVTKLPENNGWRL
jgi:hypothetical protein